MNSQLRGTEDRRQQALPKRRLRWCCVIFLAIVSTLLLIGWPLSYYRSFEISFASGTNVKGEYIPDYEIVLGTVNGRLVCEFWRPWKWVEAERNVEGSPCVILTTSHYSGTYYSYDMPRVFSMPWYGFRVYHGNSPLQRIGFGHVSEMIFPHFVPLVVFVAATYLLARPILRDRRRLRRGECIRCGYDLTASPVRCPECGARVDGERHHP